MMNKSYILRYGRHHVSGQIGGLLDYAGKLGIDNFELYDTANDRVTMCMNNGVLAELSHELDDYEILCIKGYLVKSYDAATGGLDPEVILGGRKA